MNKKQWIKYTNDIINRPKYSHYRETKRQANQMRKFMKISHRDNMKLFHDIYRSYHDKNLVLDFNIVPHPLQKNKGMTSYVAYLQICVSRQVSKDGLSNMLVRGPICTIRTNVDPHTSYHKWLRRAITNGTNIGPRQIKILQKWINKPVQYRFLNDNYVDVQIKSNK